MLADSNVWLALALSKHEQSHWKKLAGNSKAAPKLWMDAYLAAFAVAGGYQLVTTDKAFKQFKGLNHLVLSKT